MISLEKLTQKIQDQILDKSNDFDPEKAKLQWANKKYGFICFDYEGERTYVHIEQDNKPALLEWYGVKNFDELSRNKAFRELLNDIVKNNDGMLVGWRATRIGFIVILEHTFLEFNFENGHAECIQSSLLYK